jgi:cell division septal protein FtsQ
MLAQRLASKLLQRNFLLSVVAFVLTGGVLLGFSKKSGLFVVGQVPIKIESASESDQSSVFNKSGLHERLQSTVRPLSGKKIWEIDMSALRAAIASDEWVKDVLISRTFPSAMKIRVTQKNPILVLVSGKGEFSPITEEGEILSSLPAGNLPDVPLLRSEGLGKDEAEIERRRMQIVNFVMALPAKGVLTRKNISEISWNHDDGINLTVIQPRVEVKLGDDRPELKILRVTQVLNYLAQHQLKERVIDASFSKKVLVRLRKGP